MSRSARLFLAMLGTLAPCVAHAAPLQAAVMLADGQRERAVVRLAERAPPGLAAVRLEDPRTGRSTQAYVGARTLVQVEPGASPDALWQTLRVRPIRQVMPAIGLWLVEDSSRAVDGLALAARLQRHASFHKQVREAIPDFLVERVLKDVRIPPDDPRYAGQWFLNRLGMEDAWKIETGQASVTVVVIDTGCQATHPDLAGKLDPGYDAVDDDDDPTPNLGGRGNNHGTACAGLVGASTDNGVGIAGACPGCRVRCVRLLAEQGTLVPASAEIDAFAFALDVNAAVVSNSWGYKTAMPVTAVMAAAIEAIYDQSRGGLGGLVVFAAGNDSRELGDDEIEGVRGVINVGAVNNFGEVTAFSNSGKSLDVVAPTGTLTTDLTGADGDDPGDYTASFGGTSSACPLVAGVAGLLASAAPDQPASALAAALMTTAKQSPFASPDGNGHDLFYGYGQIVPAAALRMLKPEMPPPPPPKGGCSVAPGARSTGLPMAAGALVLVLLISLARRRYGSL